MAQQAYRYGRVLVDAARVLNPQFSDAVVYLTAAQLELLRNMAQYLGERATFVDTYHSNYYTLPDDTDFDDILAIVADLEVKLMGNNNVIWGYYDRLAMKEDDTTVSAGGFVQEHATPPAGEVWVVYSIGLWTDTQAAIADCTVDFLPFVIPPIAEAVTVPVNTNKVVSSLNVILKEDDEIRVTWSGLASGQHIKSYVLGYIMNVPE